MGFAGNLRTLPLPDVVQTLARIQATGVLRLAASEASRDVVFKDGAIIGVGFRDGAERQAILQRLIMQGHLDAASAAAISAAGSETQVVKSLVDQGFIDSAEVLEARMEQAEEELYSLVTLESADFVFHDAIPDEPDICAIVERHAHLGLSINGERVLMESARRLDEWARLKVRLPDGNAVFGAATDQEEALAKAGEEYPAKAVVPLVDAIRTVDDIIADAVLGRMVTFQVLVALLDKGLLVQLSRDDLLAHADYWKEQHDNRRAAQLFRKALALQPSDKEVQSKLGACLEYVGEGAEAAACYDQLAIGLLDEKAAPRACEYARHAISLMPKHPAYRMTLVRGLVMAGDVPGAVSELQKIITVYQEAGQLEDARTTCLKVLELNRDDEFARRELARIFSRVEHDQDSEDVVVCVGCGHVNHREATTCAQCKASLTLACMSCGRVVAVSDRLCIFCGSDPHQGKHREAGGNATTSRIIRRSASRRAASGIRNAVAGGSPTPGVAKALGAPTTPQDISAQALAQEEAGNLPEALALWRELAKHQPGDANLISHLKELERAINQEAVEHQIDLGHRLRRTRHLWQAGKAYRSALRAMASDDPRAKPVGEALARTEREQRRYLMVYLAAGLVLVVGAAIAVRPYWQYHRFSGEAALVEARIAELPQKDPEVLKTEVPALDNELKALDADYVQAMPQTHDRAKQANAELLSLASTFSGTRSQLIVRSLDRIAKLIEERKANDAQVAIDLHLATYPADQEQDRRAHLAVALTELKRQLKIRDDEAKDAPKRLEQAQTFEADGRLAEALGLFRQVAASTNPAASAEGKAAVDRLEPGEKAFNARWTDLAKLGSTDWAAALAGVRELKPEARKWGKEADADRAERLLGEQIAAAEAEWLRLGEDPTEAQLTAFLANHAGSAQVVLARQRLTQVRDRASVRDRMLATWRTQVEARRWAEAWQAGRDLADGYGSLLGPKDLWLPLVVESQPSGAVVTLNGKQVGVTPMVLQVRPALGKTPGDDGDLLVSAPGWTPSGQRLAQASRDWRIQVHLVRSHLWRKVLGRSITTLTALGDRFAAQGPEGIAVLDSAGEIRWRFGNANDELAGNRPPVPPTLLADGRVALVAGNRVAVLRADGAVEEELPIEGEVRGRPLGFINEAFGGELRLACVGAALETGPIASGGRKRLTLARSGLSGPVLAGPELDRLLIIATDDGHLQGIRESQSVQQGRAVPAFDLDLQASDVGQLLTVGGNGIDVGLLAVLDGSKLVAIAVRSEKASVWWSQDLKAPAVGDPAVAGGMIYQAAGQALHRLSLAGSPETPWALPAPASSPAAARGDLAAVGCKDGTLVVYRAGQPAWTSATSSSGVPVTAVTILKDRIIAGLADGSLVAFAP